MLVRFLTLRKSKKKIYLWIFLSFFIIFLLALVYSSYITYKLSDTIPEMNQELVRGEKSDKRLAPVDPKVDNFSVLVLGIDTLKPEAKGSRTDSILLVTFNSSQHSIKMVSIPRDSKVNIVGLNKEDKINHAHAYGGVDMVVNTTEHLFNLPIDYYIRLNFTAFVNIIDALGGIEINVPYTFKEQNSQGVLNTVTLQEGIQRLNGEQALAYARMRKKDPRGDFGRGERQQQIIQAVLSEAATLRSIAKYDTILDEIGANLTTNFEFKDLLTLHPYIKQMNTIESIAIKGRDITSDGIYYYELDENSINEVSTLLQEHLDLEMNNSE